ncbi:hypothetical protein phi16_gp029 [Corynebacterium phage phi16]|uniref:hypothetical protein n=1 Tax=Corynebacterium glutamicum TaxID=1718 RepID=UPI0009431A31|nr:hypothetical protein [Corynebacterium glutamicum]APQ42532.1 hypothetical protein phi16_gp029 [Corynebacterium phage phi16]OKX80473.1 hypothetical protein AUO95_09965 [Corynebacterium glutamicum]
MLQPIPAWMLPEIRTIIHKANDRIPYHHRGTDLTQNHTASLPKASLWWASQDMTKLARSAADTLPAWTPDIVRPEPIGFMLWQEPIGRIDRKAPGYTEYGRPAEATLSDADVYAVHWSIINGYFTLTFYGSVDTKEQRDRTHPVYKNIYEIGVFTTVASHNFHPAENELLDQEVNRILHVIGASWLLMQQPTVATMRKAKPKGSGSGKKNKPKPGDSVQIIDLRRLATKRSEEPSHDGPPREYSHRWLVRGHWRQQRVGPGRRYVKPVYVAPHIKGPEDAPIKEGRVSAWRR